MDAVESEKKLNISTYFAVGAVWLRLAMTDIGLRLFPARYKKRFSQQSVDEPLMLEQMEVPLQMQRMITDVRRAAAHPLWFNMSCLRRSLVLQRLLEKHGIHTYITFGVKKGQSDNIAISHAISAHAWLVVVSPVQYSGLQLDLSGVKESFTRLDYHG